MSSLLKRLRVRWTVLRGRPAPGLRTAKATFAVVAAYLLTAALGVSDHPMVAPLVALLVVQLTLYKTVVHGIGKVVAVLAGVLVAVLVANVAGVTWWSLGAVVAGSLLVGKLLRLGPHLFEAPITAMLLLEVGATGGLGASRVGEAIVGAVVGIAVSVLVAPPLYVQPAGEAIGELAHRMADFSRGFAEGLRGPGWSREAADHWLREVRALRTDVVRVDQAVAQAEESARLHPRARSARRARPRLRLRSTLTGLERAHITLRTIARAVLDRTYYMPEDEQQDTYTTRQRAALADVLTTAAAAIDAVAPIAGADDPQQARSRVHALLADLDEQQQLLNSLLAVRPEQDQAAWKQHGALLSSIDRLSVEIATAASEPGLESDFDLIGAGTD
jgi:uncharacterized membrane protein YgaE (UPF0421/DUF939 family)